MRVAATNDAGTLVFPISVGSVITTTNKYICTRPENYLFSHHCSYPPAKHSYKIRTDEHTKCIKQDFGKAKQGFG